MMNEVKNEVKVEQNEQNGGGALEAPSVTPQTEVHSCPGCMCRGNLFKEKCCCGGACGCKKG